MGISVGTIFEWVAPGIPEEECQDGQCIGKVVDVGTLGYLAPVGRTGNRSDTPAVMVTFWEMCRKHTEIDPDGTGPYELEYIWQIGQTRKE